MKKRTKKLLLRFAKSFQGHWPKIIKVFLLLFVHKKKFFLFSSLFKIIFPFYGLGATKNFMCHRPVAHTRNAEQKSFWFFFVRQRTISLPHPVQPLPAVRHR